jgi:hypothetical protein
MAKVSDYYPSEIKLETFPNKIYLLTWMQNGTLRTKLLNKAKAFAMVNDVNVDKRIKDELVKAFKAGEII